MTSVLQWYRRRRTSSGAFGHEFDPLEEAEEGDCSLDRSDSFGSSDLNSRGSPGGVKYDRGDSLQLPPSGVANFEEIVQEKVEAKNATDLTGSIKLSVSGGMSRKDPLLFFNFLQNSKFNAQ